MLQTIFFTVELLFLSIVSILPILIAVAFFTLAERKTMALVQRRSGPNITGFWGLLQPIADGFKLLLKEVAIPARANPGFFIFSPVLAMSLSFAGWGLIPFNFTSVFSDLPLSLLVLFLFSSLNVYSVVLAGWSSNSKYALLGALRAMAQLISYELAMALSIIPVAMCSGSLNLIDIVNFQKNAANAWFLFPAAVTFFICIVAETNRAPFDLPEAEAEIVAGYNIEYPGMPFALFFLGEYCQIILMSGLFVILFCGGWLSILPGGYFLLLPPSFVFGFKTCLVCFFFVFIRANLPRYRYDQLMEFGWKMLIPGTLGYIFFIAGYLLFFSAAPAF
jgi:NADH-quinone oxidoreductase subunit H